MQISRNEKLRVTFENSCTVYDNIYIYIYMCVCVCVCVCVYMMMMW
jgi:hypothetical protein